MISVGAARYGDGGVCRIQSMETNGEYGRTLRFESMVEPPMEMEGRQAWWFCVGQNGLLVHVEGDARRVPLVRHPEELGIRIDHEHFLGVLDDVPVWVGGIDRHMDGPEGLSFEQLRSLYTRLPEPVWTLAGRAVQVAEWHRTHQFCGRCGERTELSRGERARKCPSCGLLNFPRLSPAVITVVTRGEEALLARGRTFAGPMYSALAGFVEPGESLEQCVEREVREEVGIEIANIRYFKSQPWPFPNSLMVGFYADYVSGEIQCQESEIVDAKWFKRDELPNTPGGMSIAKWLIDGWVQGKV